MLAYKHLVRNIPLPSHENFGLEGVTWENYKEKLRQKGGNHMLIQWLPSAKRPKRTRSSEI